MATYVLVHGGFHGGWCWSRVATRLRAAGHEVYTPTLTGLGERSHLLSQDIDLETHIEDVLGVLTYEQVDGAILCGHSYGGLVITAVADRAPDRVASLVYVDAFVPGDGQSLFDFFPPGADRMAQAEADAHGDGWRMSAPPAASYDVVDTEDCAWVERLLTPHPLRTCTDKVVLTGAVEAFAGRRTFVTATDYRRKLFFEFYQSIQEDPSWRSHALPGGHNLMVDQPEALANILSNVGRSA